MTLPPARTNADAAFIDQIENQARVIARLTAQLITERARNAALIEMMLQMADDLDEVHRDADELAERLRVITLEHGTDEQLDMTGAVK